MADILVAIATQDPYFQFAARALIGRDRETRIHSIADNLANLWANLEVEPKPRVEVAIIDLDTIARVPSFYIELRGFIRKFPDVKIMLLVESALVSLPQSIKEIPIRALLAKSDLGYCLHVAIHVLHETDWVLVTQKTQDRLISDKLHLVRPEKEHPHLPPRIAELVHWRIFVGLDNGDIRHELILAEDTVRGYISEAYKILDISDKHERELKAFRAMSQWWRKSRFS